MYKSCNNFKLLPNPSPYLVSELSLRCILQSTCIYLVLTVRSTHVPKGTIRKRGTSFRTTLVSRRLWFFSCLYETSGSGTNTSCSYMKRKGPNIKCIIIMTILCTQKKNNKVTYLFY